MRTPPFTVRLRNDAYAIVTQVCDSGWFPLKGYLIEPPAEMANRTEEWQRNGCWHIDGKPRQWDIVDGLNAPLPEVAHLYTPTKEGL